MAYADNGEFPLRQFLGMDVHSVEPGHAVASLEVTPDHLNPHGVVHGGVMFTMVDTAMGLATMSSLEEGQTCATIEIQVRFLAPVTSGRLEADTTVVRRGRKVVHLESRISDQDAALVASADGTFVISST